MKYEKEKEVSPIEKLDCWKGDYITKLEPNEIFVFGANPILSSYQICPLYCPNKLFKKRKSFFMK